MLRNTLVAVAAAVLAGSVGASYAQDVEKTTTLTPEGMGSKEVVRKTIHTPGSDTVVQKKKVIHRTGTGVAVVHKTTVVNRPYSKTVIHHPSETIVRTER